MEIYYMYTKQVKEFGRMARFDDEPCEVRGAPPLPPRVESKIPPRHGQTRSVRESSTC